MDLPFSLASVRPSGVRTPWLIALLRKSTLAGSMNTEVSGRSEFSTRKSMTSPARALNHSTNGPATTKPTIARIMPQMPAE